MKTTKLLISLLTLVLLTGVVLAQQNENESAAIPVTNETAVAETNATVEPQTNEQASGEPEAPSPRKSRAHRNPLVVIGNNSVLKKGDSAEAVVVIGGSAKVDGEVDSAAVVVLGDLEINGEVNEAAVAVLGNVRLGPEARVNGDVVSVGGRVDAAEGAVIRGHTQAIDWQVPGMPKLAWLKDWIVHCALKVRPLAPQLGWLWVIVGIVTFFYLLIAVLFPRPVQACLEEISRRPATTFLLGLLTLLLVPLVLLLLTATGVGLLAVPFVLAALFLAGLVGKVGLLEWIGVRISIGFGADALSKPLPAFLAGTIVVLLLYMIPVIGLLAFLITGIWGLGCALSAVFGGVRREREIPAATAGAIPVSPVVPVASAAGPVLAAAVPVTGGTPPLVYAQPKTAPPSHGSARFVPTGTADTVQPPILPEALSYPRAGFWERMGAGFLDLILLTIASQPFGGLPFGFFLALAYFAGMWTWKGTTIGGIVLGLKVVRVDGQQSITLPVGIVRALAAAFSIVVLFLGFFWIAWDKDRQGWHDRIAGTVVIRLPKGTPLICL